jgi:hypothetical protein
LTFPAVLLAGRLLTGAYLGAFAPPPPPEETIGVSSDFSVVEVSPDETTTATCTLRRTGPTTASCTVELTVTGASANPITQAMLSGTTLGVAREVTIPAGQSEVEVTIAFAAQTPPASDLFGVVSLDNPSTGYDIDLSASGFTFEVDRASSRYGFGDDYSTNWTYQKGHASCEIAQDGNGAVIVTSGTSPLASPASSSFLWCKTPAPGNYIARFKFTWLDGFLTTSGGGVFTIFIGRYRGTVLPGNPNNWDAGQYGLCDDAVLDAGGEGDRTSFNQRNSVSPGNDNQFRKRRYDAGGAVAIDAEGNEDAVFNPNVAYDVEFRRLGDIETCTQSRAGEADDVVVFDDPTIGDQAGRYFGLRFSSGRKCRISEFTLEEVFSPASAVDDSVTTFEDTSVDIDVLDNDVGAGDLSITSFTQPANGTVIRVGDLLRFTPTTGYTGTTSFTYTMSDETTSDTATVSVDVVERTAAGTVPWDAALYHGVLRTLVEAEDDGDLIEVSSVGDLGSTVAGKHYVLDASVSGSITVDGTGTKADPIVIRGNSDGAASTFSTWGTGTLTISGATHVTFKNIYFGNTAIEIRNSRFITFERCQFVKTSLDGGDEQLSYGLYIGSGTRGLRFIYCIMGPRTGDAGWVKSVSGTGQMSSDNPRDLYWYRCRYNSMIGGGHYLDFGRTGTDNNKDVNAWVVNCLFEDNPNGYNLLEIKGYGLHFIANTMELHGDRQDVRKRHGNSDSGSTEIIRPRGRSDVYRGNLFVTRPGAGGKGFITVRDAWTEVVENWAVTLPDGAQPTLSSGSCNADIDLHTGNVDEAAYPDNRVANQAVSPQSHGTIVAANFGFTIINGRKASTRETLPARYNRIAPTDTSSRLDANRGCTINNVAGLNEFTDTTTETPTAPDIGGVRTAVSWRNIPHRWLRQETGCDAIGIS